MKLFARILIILVSTFLVGNVVVNACGDEQDIVIAKKERSSAKAIETETEFPMVTSLVRF